MTNYNVEEKDLFGEQPITVEHIQNNKTVREMLGTLPRNASFFIHKLIY